jgi:hypothetical protein
LARYHYWLEVLPIAEEGLWSSQEMSMPQSKIVAAEAYEIVGFAGEEHRFRLYGQSMDCPLAQFIQHLVFYDNVVILAEDLFALVSMFQTFDIADVRTLFESSRVQVVLVKGKPVIGRPSHASDGQTDLLVMSHFNSTGLRRKSGLPLDLELDRVLSYCRSHGIESPPREVLLRSIFEYDLECVATEIADHAKKVISENDALMDWTGCKKNEENKIVLPSCEINVIHAQGMKSDVASPLKRTHAVFQLACIRRIVSDFAHQDYSTSATVHEAMSLTTWGRKDIAGSEVALLEIRRLPYVGGYVWHSPPKLGPLLKLLDKSDASSFRKWFSSTCAGQSDLEVSRRYIDLCEQTGWLGSMPGKAMRVLLTSLIPISGVAGLTFSMAENVLGDKLAVPGPRVFLRRLEKFVNRAGGTS